MWVPQDSRAISNRDFIEANFGPQYRGGSVLFVSTKATDNDIINLDAFEQIWDVHESIVADASVGSRSFDNLCAIKTNTGDCFVFGVVQFFSANRTYYNSVVNSRDDLVTALSAENFPDGSPVNRNQIYGDYDVDSNNRLTSCRGTTMYYQVDGESESTAIKWEKEFISVLEKEPDGELEIYYFANRSVDDELARTIGGDISLMIITYVVMTFITCMVFMKRWNLVETRSGLALCGIGIILLSMVAGYGLCSGLGEIFVSIHQVLPFIIVGIGVDDMFIIMATFLETDESEEIDERMSKTMRRCGMSITYTTATNVTAFYLGATSTLPAVRAFCLFAATSVAFNFLYQITMFNALLCLDEQRMQKNKIDLLFCITGKDRLSTAASAKAISDSSFTGDAEVSEENKSTVDADTIIDAETKKVAPQQKSLFERDSKELTRMQWFFSEIYWPLITKPMVRVAILLGFAALLAVNIYATTNVEQGFDIINLVPDDSYVKDYITEARSLDLFIFEQNLPVAIVYKDIPYHEQAVQEEMMRIENGFLELPHNVGPLDSWITDFQAWVASDASAYKDSLNSDGYLTGEPIFYQAVQDFLQDPDYSRLDRDIIFDSNNKIVASRATAYHINMADSKDQIKGMTDARKFVRDTFIEPKPFAYSDAYTNIETEVLIVDEMTLNLVLALVAVALVSLFIVIRPTAVLLICVFVAVIDIDIIGTMYFWGLQINTVTVVQMVMAVGLVVDYVAHILHYYLKQPFHLNEMERLKGALIEIGPSILLGCSTTFIGILPLAFASSDIFRTFFRMFFSIIVYGAGHGLLLLPVVLPSLPFGDISHLLSNKNHEPVKAVELPEKKTLESTNEITEVEDGKNNKYTAVAPSEQVENV